jgi:phosphoribosylformylglycinamidine cyclo-ligase
MNYLNSGVNIEKSNIWTNIIKKLTNSSENIGQFGGIYNHNGINLVACVDGVGTKIELAKRFNVYDTIGIDLVAMCINDLIVMGARPLFFLDYISIGILNIEITTSIFKGIQEGCNKSGNISIIGGETAEMPIYGEDYLDLAGFAIGVIEENKNLESFNKEININDILYGFASSGIHSNGYSLINNIINKLDDKETLSNELQDILLKQTKIYFEDIKKLEKSSIGKYIKGYCHITGGGIIDNLPRIFKNNPNKSNKNITYQIDRIDIPEIFHWIYEKSNMSLKEMLNTFNCGIGFIVIFDKEIENDKDYINLIKNKEDKYFYKIGKIIENKEPIYNINSFENM